VPVHLGPIQSPILTIVPTLGLYIVEQEGMMTLYQTLIKEQIPNPKRERKIQNERTDIL